MPISFQPAQPNSSSAAAAFGAAQQYNQIVPTLASLYESVGRNFTQASAGTAGNITQGNIASAQNQSRMNEIARQQAEQERYQMTQIQAQREAQQKQIDAQRQMQFDQFAYQGQKVSQAEQMQMTRQQNGLDEIRQQVQDGTLTEQQGADAILQLKSGINMTQKRLQDEQMQNIKAQEQLRAKQLENATLNKVKTEKFLLDAADKGVSIINVPDRQGNDRFLAYDQNAGKYYNPFNEHSSKSSDGGNKAGGEWAEFETKNGEFDYAKARKRSEHLVQFDPEVGKEWSDGRFTKFDSIKEPAAQKWIADNVAALKSAYDEAKKSKTDMGATAPPQQAPPPPPTPDQILKQDVPKSAPEPVKTAVSAIDKTQDFIEKTFKGDDFAIAAGKEALAKIKQITTSYPSLAMAPPQIQQEYAAAKQSIATLIAQAK